MIAILGAVNVENDDGGFMLFMAQTCLYSTIEMMQADANIANNSTQNDTSMERRNSRHHGSSIYMYSSSMVNPNHLKYRKMKNIPNESHTNVNKMMELH